MRRLSIIIALGSLITNSLDAFQSSRFTRFIKPLRALYSTSTRNMLRYGRHFSQMPEKHQIATVGITSLLAATGIYKAIDKRYNFYKALDYEIHLLWINKALNPQQKYIYPSEDKTEVHEKLIQPLVKWAATTASAPVILWYDGDLVPSGAVEETKRLLEKEPCFSLLAPIEFKDIRQSLSTVKTHKDVFSPALPVYFRVDLLKMITTLKSKKRYCVFSDLDIQKTQSKLQLFDHKTQQYLKKFGIVVKRGGFLGFENGFHIVDTHNNNTVKALEFGMIAVNIQRAYNHLSGSFCNILQRADPQAITQVVYDSFESFFAYLYYLQGYGTLSIEKYDRTKERMVDIPYDQKVDGLEPFGLTTLVNRRLSFTPHSKSSMPARTNLWPTAALPYCGVPTKAVSLPEPSFKYD